MLPLSLVIPTINEESNISIIYNNIKILDTSEVIIVDGGSKDKTKELLKQYCIINAFPSRGEQLHLGYQKSNEAWVLFLHADTILNEKNVLEIKKFINNNTYNQIAYFRLKFDEKSISSNLISFWANFRTILFKLPFGDQGLLINRKYYKEIGGFSLIPIMEDMDIMTRIPKNNKFLFDSTIITSFRKYKNNGIIKQSLENITNQIKFFLK